MAQLKSGKFKKTLECFNIKKSVLQIKQIQQYSADEKNVRLSVIFKGFEENMESASQDFNLLSDKKRIQQVLLNLQSNALKFTQPGGEI